MSDNRTKAEELVSRAKDFALASVDAAGYPKIVTVLKVENDGLKEIVFTTYRSSEKAQNFQKNPKAGSEFVEKYCTVALTGDVTIHTDTDTLNKYWNDHFLKYFPQGPTDPNYCICRLHCKHVKLSLDFEHSEFDL